MDGEGGPFGDPMMFRPPTEEEKAEAERLRELQTRSVNAEIVKSRADAVLKLAQAANAVHRRASGEAVEIANAMRRVAESIES